MLYLAIGIRSRTYKVHISLALYLLIIQYLIEYDYKDAMYNTINIMPPNNTKDIKYRVQIEQ